MMMTLIKFALVLPALVAGLWLAREAPPVKEAAFASTGVRAVEAKISDVKARRVSPESRREAKLTEAVVTRRVRIERILMTLDRVAEVTLQMSPDKAMRLEPVLVDLAEQTVKLTSAEAVLRTSTDNELDEIEKTVDRLVTVVERTVEPEMTL